MSRCRGRLHQFLKDSGRERFLLPNSFGMPLHSNHEMVREIALYGFDHAVGRPRHHPQAAADLVERLVMRTVHQNFFRSSRPVSHPRTGGQCDGMMRLAILEPGENALWHLALHNLWINLARPAR